MIVLKSAPCTLFGHRSGRKYALARDFLEENSNMPLTLPQLSDFDRALAVQAAVLNIISSAI